MLNVGKICCDQSRHCPPYIFAGVLKSAMYVVGWAARQRYHLVSTLAEEPAACVVALPLPFWAFPLVP
jgi:hypothetical protein